MDFHIPEHVGSQYADNIGVQARKHDTVISFFETQLPPFIGTPEENRALLEKPGSIRTNCVGRIIIAADLLPEIMKALQTTYDGYLAIKEGKQMIKYLLTHVQMIGYTRVNLGAAATAAIMNVSVTSTSGTDFLSSTIFTSTTEVAISQQTADDLEEQRWKAVISQPHVQRGLDSLATRIRKQIAAGEGEEGGFAVE